MKAYGIVLAALSALVASNAMAGNPLKLGTPAFNGNGCAPGTADAVLNDDGTQLSVSFSDFQNNVGGTAATSSLYKKCDITIPVLVPQGFQISVLRIDYRGFNNLPGGARSHLEASYFFPGMRGATSVRDFQGPLTENYTVTDNLAVSSLVWSRCGAPVNMRNKVGLFTQTNYQNEEATSSVDSIDYDTNKIIYQVQWRQCQ